MESAPDWMQFNVYYPHDGRVAIEPPLAQIETAAAAIYNRVNNYPACTTTVAWEVFRVKYQQRAEEYMKNARVALIAVNLVTNHTGE